jgi:hypothetical protein
MVVVGDTAVARSEEECLGAKTYTRKRHIYVIANRNYSRLLHGRRPLPSISKWVSSVCKIHPSSADTKLHSAFH